jgi:hypothetical protein
MVSGETLNPAYLFSNLFGPNLYIYSGVVEPISLYFIAVFHSLFNSIAISCVFTSGKFALASSSPLSVSIRSNPQNIFA